MSAPVSTRVSLAPVSRLSVRRQLQAGRNYHVGGEWVRASDGPVVRLRTAPDWLRLPKVAFVTSAQGAHDLLASHAPTDKYFIGHEEVRRVWGLNLFSMVNADWIARRRTIQPLFTKKHVATYAGHMGAVAEDLARSWCESPGPVDLDHDTRKLAMGVVGRSVFGLDFSDRDDLHAPIKHMLLYVTKRASRPVRAPGWLPTPARAGERRARALVLDVIEQAISRTERTGEGELIRLLLETRDPETGMPLTREQVRDELMVFVLAGHDTTATTLCYTLWQLGRHPEIQDRVAAEVEALGDRPLTVDDVAALPYTVQVLHEALRLCPPAPAVGRYCMEDAVIDGRLLPRGTNVILGIWAIHRDPACWERPTEFDPDRFAAGRAGQRDRWAFLPFGGGARSCIGDHFAMLEATLGIATLVRSVRVASVEDEFPIALPFTLTAGGRIPAQVTPRERGGYEADRNGV